MFGENKFNFLGRFVSIVSQSIDDQSYKDLALTRLGNAYEDLAWLAKVSVNENYQSALDKFEEAIKERPDLPDPWVGRGRCFYKREADSRQTGKGYMNNAWHRVTVICSDRD